MNDIRVVFSVLIYALLLIGIGFWALRAEHEKRRSWRGWAKYKYGLSLAVFCSAWTYFGSIGVASTNSLSFLPVYIGPMIFMPLIVLVLGKAIRIARLENISSLADFISSRYGKSVGLGIWVTLFFIIGIIPYIAIQIKAIGFCMELMLPGEGNALFFKQHSELFSGLFLALFIIVFSAGRVSDSGQNKALIQVIAIETIVKLLAFISIGVFVLFFVFSGPADLFGKVNQAFPELLSTPYFARESPFGWFVLNIISGLSIILLPRQFQVGVIENENPRHLRTALWVFPLYLFLINLFVFPIALGGSLLFKDMPLDPDTYILSIPLSQNQPALAMVAFLGGLSAATAMVMVETVALTTMLTNNIVLPLALRNKKIKQNLAGNAARSVIWGRRLGILTIISGGYFYDSIVANRFSLVSIGFISFAGVAQLAPALIGGMYWSGATRKAAYASFVSGAFVWFYTLILPSFAGVSGAVKELVAQGPFGLELLKPTALFGMTDLGPVAHGAFWSLLLNILVFIATSLFTQKSAPEILQSALFVHVEKFSDFHGSETLWQGKIPLKDLQQVLGNFLGPQRASALLQGYANRHNIALYPNEMADPRMVKFGERILSGVIGSASARIMIGYLAREEQVNVDEILNMVKESRQFIELNKQLRKQSVEISKAREALEKTNRQLTEMADMKDEFLYTVTHELRTPLTSIRALSEILYDNPDLEEEQKQKFLQAISDETERLGHLITRVLNLERYESGRYKLNMYSFDLHDCIEDVMRTAETLAAERNIRVSIQNFRSHILVYADKDLLTQVIYNLVANAIKFARSEIVIHAFVHDNEANVWVQDDGPGVPYDIQQSVFDKFFQVKNASLRKPEGSGLGLAITRRIIEMHQGKIWVESKPGNGATFKFSIPLP